MLVASRWSAQSLALTHIYVLGVLGNGMLGSLHEFLPVALAAKSRPLRIVALPNLLLFNLGTALLVVGFFGSKSAISSGALLLGCSLVAFSVLALLALRHAEDTSWTRRGISIALFGLLATATIGVSLASRPAPPFNADRATVTDLHATLGLVGWILALLGAVAVTVLPMFQGIARWSNAWQRRSWIAAGCLLVAALGGRTLGWLDTSKLALLAGLPFVGFALTVLRGQRRRRSGRRPSLVAAWRFAALVMLSVWLLGAAEAGGLAWPSAMTTAAWLLVGTALPGLLMSMQLEITAFALWNNLLRRRPPGSHAILPGVDHLVRERDKRRVLHCTWLQAGTLLVAGLGDHNLIWNAAAAAQAAVGLVLALCLTSAFRRAVRTAEEFDLRTG